MINLREKAIKGVAWSAVEKWGTQAFSFVIFLILARLLNPEDFGLVALATVFTAFIQIFLDQGFSAAIIQRDVVEPIHLDTAFWVNMMAGILFAGVTVWFAPSIAVFFNSPELTPIIKWLSLVFIFVALSSTQQAILRRDFLFRSLATRTLIARIAGGLVGIGFALSGFGVWSLVAQNLFGAFVGVLVLWRVSDWRPGFRFSGTHFVELFKFGFNIFGGKILGFFSVKIDNFLIGYFLGPTQLGYYTIAYSLLERILDLFQGVTASVIFPTFSRLQNQPKKLQRVFFVATELTAFIAFPIFIGLFVLAPEFIVGLFGKQWSLSISVMRVLALVGILMSVSSYIGQFIIASGKPERLLILQISATLVRVIGFLLVVNQGIIAVAWVFVLSTYAIVPFYLWVAIKVEPFSLKEYLSHLILPIFTPIIMGLLILWVKYFLGGHLGNAFENIFVQLILYTVIGGVLYLLMVYLFKPSIIHQVFELTEIVFIKNSKQA